MRRFGESVVPGKYYRTRPGAYAIIRYRDDLLATEATEPDHELQLPGGGIDPGESPLQALHREVMEETGWRIRILRRLGAFQRYTYMPEYDLWARKVCHIYLCAPALRHGPPGEAHHSPVWMPLTTAARELSVPGDRWFVQSLLG